MFMLCVYMYITWKYIISTLVRRYVTKVEQEGKQSIGHKIAAVY